MVFFLLFLLFSYDCYCLGYGWKCSAFYTTVHWCTVCSSCNVWLYNLCIAEPDGPGEDEGPGSEKNYPRHHQVDIQGSYVI